MLGGEQEKWLFGNLASARSTWTVLGQQVPTFARDAKSIDPATRFPMDKWDGYVAARNRLYARLKETNAPNPVLLSGDVHQHYGGDLKLDYTRPDSETIGVEFTNTAITSGGDGVDTTPAWEQIKSDNPHIKYNSARRGYIACTATPRVDARGLQGARPCHRPRPAHSHWRLSGRGSRPAGLVDAVVGS